ncbi:hypothetical protein [Kribbella solani]|uniref:Uncharacterized protein n=1 Tax=Kribbella solani TaxID=236067 RepID=A0A841DV11_9ACTN|nr:hypothetical protein [Kribbella solani]MBB5982452.1 hypothetical protein [Kribbella solani]
MAYVLATLSAMGQDMRHFEVEVGDDDPERLWIVLAATEAAALEAAKQYRHNVDIAVSGEHTTGKLFRDSAAEAKETMDRYGFRPGTVRLYIRQVKEERALPWVEAGKYVYDNKVKVQVLNGTEVEVNGVFTLLQNAVQAALQLDKSSTAVPVVASQRLSLQRRAWRLATTHPLIVTVVGGVAAVVIAAWLGFGNP